MSANCCSKYLKSIYFFDSSKSAANGIKLATFPLELNKKILFKTLSTQMPATVILRKFAAELK